LANGVASETSRAGASEDSGAFAVASEGCASFRRESSQLREQADILRCDAGAP